MRVNQKAVDRRRLFYAVGLLFLALLISLLFPGTGARQAPADWQWITCDVGQGDAHLLRTGEKHAALLDTGDDYPALADCLAWAQVEHLEAVLLTHQHSDHYGALQELAQEIPLGRVFVSAHFDTDKLPGDLPVTALSTLPNQPPPQIELGLNARAQLLWPPAQGERIPGAAGSSAYTNNTSLVLHISLGDAQPLTLLTTGDLEQDAAARLTGARAGELTASVLKVAHHGSQGSGTELIDAVNPALALIPVGAGNDYGHPHRLITDHLQAQGIRVARTDTGGHLALVQKAGSIEVTFSGKGS